MKHESRTTNPQESWSSSRCQRILRPLKLKISALERTLTTSFSVSDGLSSWAGHSTERRTRHDSATDSSASYNPNSTNFKRYGAARKQKPAHHKKLCEIESLLMPDVQLASLRASVSPSLGNAYTGVYYAFRTILEKTDADERFPSLAARAASAVGHCIHLTGPHFTDQPLEPDDWYEAAPEHLRSFVVIGHAIQILISSSAVLVPLLPALILSLGQTPPANELLDALLENTSLVTMRKKDVHTLDSIASQIGSPWALQAYVTREFKIEYLGHAALSPIFDVKNESSLDDYTTALYIKANVIFIQYLTKYGLQDSYKDHRIREGLREIARKLIRRSSTATINYIKDLWLRIEDETLIGTKLEYLIAALIHEPSDVVLIKSIAATNQKLVRFGSDYEKECLIGLIDQFGPEKIVTGVEVLVGRVDDLAVTLANHCAAYLEGDFVQWAADKEADITRARCSTNSDKYRYEPLLDSWVARTPGLQKIKSAKAFSHVEDTDEDDLSTGEEDYDADQSRTQLSFMELDCEDDEDLISRGHVSPLKSVGSKVLDLLSARRSTDTEQSARLMQRYGRSTNFELQGSPLASKTVHRRAISAQSPVPLKKRKLHKMALETGSGSEGHDWPVPRKRTRSAVLNGLCNSQSPREPRVMRGAQRELNNLKSSFASLRRQKRAGRQTQTQSRSLAGRGLVNHNDDRPPRAGSGRHEEEGLAPLPKSESDELCLL